MPECLRQARSRFGTQRKREGGIGIVERMIANALRKPVRVRLRRLSLAGYLPVHDESSIMNVVSAIRRSGRLIALQLPFAFRPDKARKLAAQNPVEIVHDRKGGRHEYETEKGRGEQSANQRDRHRGTERTAFADSPV